MTKRTLTLIGLGSLSIALVGCSGSGKSDNYKPKAQEKITPATIVPGKEAELLPIKTGNTWVFNGESTQSAGQGTSTNQAEVTFRVTDVTDSPEGQVATVEVTTDGTLSDRLKWRVGPSGIYQISASVRDKKDGPLREVVSNPAVPIVPFPVKPGSNVSVSCVGVRPIAGVGKYTAKVTTEGVQEVDSDMGRFSALSVTGTSDYSEKNVKFTAHTGTFWAPNVGPVRYILEVSATNDKGQAINTTTILRLKSHTP